MPPLRASDFESAREGRRLQGLLPNRGIAGGGFTFEDPAMQQQMALNTRNLLARPRIEQGSMINVNRNPGEIPQGPTNPNAIAAIQAARQRFGDRRGEMLGMNSSMTNQMTPAMGWQRPVPSRPPAPFNSSLDQYRNRNRMRRGQQQSIGQLSGSMGFR